MAKLIAKERHAETSCGPTAPSFLLNADEFNVLLYEFKVRIAQDSGDSSAHAGAHPGRSDFLQSEPLLAGDEILRPGALRNVGGHQRRSHGSHLHHRACGLHSECASRGHRRHTQLGESAAGRPGRTDSGVTSNRSTRNHTGRCAGALSYCAKLLQRKLDSGCSCPSSPARAGFRCTYIL